MSRPKTIAAIPCCDEASHIGDIVNKTKEYVDEVIVIDDGSTDDTARSAQAAGASVVSHGANKGYGASIKSCFRAMKTSKADVLVTLDGDGQHDPSYIPSLLAPIYSGEADVVIGSRFLSGANSTPRYRKFGIHLINFLYNFGSKTKVSDAQSGFRAYSRRALDTVNITMSGMGASAEAIIKIREKGFTIKEVPISCTYHSASHSANPVTHGLSVALAVVRFRLKSLIHKLIGGDNA